MPGEVDRCICPALSAPVESWLLFPGRGADGQDAVYIVGNRGIDRYITVPAAKLDIVRRMLDFFDGQHSIEYIENWLLENAGVKVNVSQFYEHMVAANLLRTQHARSLPRGDQFTEWSLRLFTVPVDWLFRRTAVLSKRWLPALLLFSAVLIGLGATCFIKLGIFRAAFHTALHGPGIFLYLLFLMASFAVHEIAHGIVASWFGLVARRFTAALYLGFIPMIYLRIGGLYTLSPKRRVAVWIAGVWCNFLLASAGAVVLTISAAHTGPTGRYFLSHLTVANLTMGIFNLFPFLPTDGYFILSTVLRTYNVRRQAWRQVVALTRLRFSSVSWFATLYFLVSCLTLIVLLRRMILELFTTPVLSTAGFFNIFWIAVPVLLLLWRMVFRRLVGRLARR